MTDTSEPTATPDVQGEQTTPAQVVVARYVDPLPAPITSADPLVRQSWDESIWRRLF